MENDKNGYVAGWKDPRNMSLEELLANWNLHTQAKNGVITAQQFYRATKEIIDRCVAPDMHANAMSMLERAVKEIG